MESEMEEVPILNIYIFTIYYHFWKFIRKQMKDNEGVSPKKKFFFIWLTLL